MRAFTSYTRVLALTLLAALTTACLSSGGLAAWADALPASAPAEWASAASHTLDSAMITLGLNRPAAFIQKTTRALEAKKFTPTTN